MTSTSKPVSYDENGVAYWQHQPLDRYIVVGWTRDGQQVAQVFHKWEAAQMQPLLSGTRYLLRNGKRYILETTNEAKTAELAKRG